MVCCPSSSKIRFGSFSASRSGFLLSPFTSSLATGVPEVSLFSSGVGTRVALPEFLELEISSVDLAEGVLSPFSASGFETGEHGRYVLSPTGIVPASLPVASKSNK